MPAPAIGTNAQQVRDYANSAEMELGNISTALSELLDACVTVPYWGNNGRDFKTKTATSATEMSDSIWKAVDKFTQTVNAANQAIARTLGGDVTIDGLTKPSTQVPTIGTTGPAGETGEGLYPTALTDLQDKVNTQRDKIIQATAAHQTALTSKTPEWVGNQKDTAVGACGAMTEAINTAVTTGFGEINAAIAAQHEATTAADA